MDEVKKKVSCARTLTLIERSLSAGFIDVKGVHVKPKIGTPQGSILSPLLSNIVLNKLDEFMESLRKELNVGKKRKVTSRYMALGNRRNYYKSRDPVIARQALLEMRKIPSKDMHDNSFRRALYIRYADDFVVLMANTLTEAEKLKARMAVFLKEDCGLELNQEKTLITNTRDGFMFLGA